MKTILLIDNDLGFVFWFGQVLDLAGYEAYPAKSVRDACVLIDQLQLRVDVLIVNVGLEGAPAFVDGIRRSRRSLRVIALADGEASPAVAPEADLIRGKPERIDEVSRSEWLQLVQCMAEAPC